jgi:hypothetical protein
MVFNCENYQDGICFYIPNYLDKGLSEVQECIYSLIEGKNGENTAEKCNIKTLIQKLQARDEILRKEKLDKNF